jgi:hypothetical protein
LTFYAVRYHWSSLEYPGRYGVSTISLRIWLYQTFSWMLILLLMKSLIFLLIYFLRNPLGYLACCLFFPVKKYPKIELLIVMIGCPLMMNMVQFWIQDSFLKDQYVEVDDRTISKEEQLPLLSIPPPSISNITNKRKESFTKATSATEMYEDLG